MTQQFHFFGSNPYEWKTGESLTDVIDWFAKQKNAPFQLWHIPAPDGAIYSIEYYQPQAKGATFLGVYKGKKLVKL